MNALVSYQKLIPSNHAANSRLMTLLTTRYASQLRYESSSADVMVAMQTAKTFVELIAGTESEESLDLSTFYRECSSLLVKNPSSLKPADLLNLLNNFSANNQFKDKIVRDVLKLMRQDKYDIRAFNFDQLVSFIQIVSETQIQDVQVFRNYLDAAISQTVFTSEDLSANFRSFLKLMHNFALNSMLEEGATMFKFLILMKDAVNNNNKEIKHNLIGTIWTLIAREIKLTDAKQRLNTSD